MMIDWEHHWEPIEIFNKRGKPGNAVIEDKKVRLYLFTEMYQIEKHIEFMDAAGIDMAVLSTHPASVEDCKLIDDHYLRITKDYPTRFTCLAPCIPTIGKEALNELERAVSLGLKGVVIRPQTDGHPLDSRKLWPFYEMVLKLDIPIFVHITSVPVGYDALDAPYNMNIALTREFDIAANTVRLILGGVLSSFPNLKFVIAHMGGGISAILDRLETWVDILGDRFWTDIGGTPPFEKPFKEKLRQYFGKLYFNVAGCGGNIRTVKIALTAISPERLVFGTDWPFEFTNDPQGVKDYIENIRNLGLSQEAADGILCGNAARLLNIKT